MAELQVLNGPLQWKTFKLTGPRFLVGRKESCHLILKDGWVSREHSVVIQVASDEFVVQDLDSENGIYVNGDRVKDARLSHADILRIGRTEMRFFNPTDADSESASDQRRDGTVPEPLREDRVGTGQRTSAQEIPDVGTESGGFDLTVHEPGRKTEPRADFRERLRRLEKLLLRKEEDNARLAAENTVLKRAMAQGGLIDPQTGQVDMNRLTAPVTREVVPRGMLPVLSNPLARMMFPCADGSVALPADVEQAADLAIGVRRIGVIGAGSHGTRFAGSFYRTGWRRTVALSGDHEALAVSGVPEEAWVELPAPAERSMREVANLVTEHQLRVEAVLGSAIGHDRELHLICAALEDINGVGAVGPLLDRIAEVRSVACPDAPPARTALLLLVGTGAAVADAAASASEGLTAVRRLHEAGRLRPFVVCEPARLVAANEAVAISDPDGTVVGALDVLERMPLFQTVAGDLDAKHWEAVQAEEGISSIGLAAAGGTSEEELDAMMRLALSHGWLCGSMPPSRGRFAVVVLLIGSEDLVGDLSTVARLESAVDVAREILPQAKVTAGIYEDSGSGVRVVAWVGGLPFPENLVP
ncbi:MAG: hypothetical protein CMJ83_19755 [Planctomycetes bacterium]|nr:hypothetical protein [Planctomycetota bacterium]